MTIDISKIKPGDRVTLVPLEVVSIYSPRGNDPAPAQIETRCDSQARIFWITPDQIAAHHPAPREFQVGDRVRAHEFVGDWYVEHIAGGHAWIKPHNNAATPSGWLIELDKLTLVEARGMTAHTWWFLEADDGKWLENSSHSMLTRDPNRALRWPNRVEADDFRRQLRHPLWRLTATEHMFVPLSASPAPDPAVAVLEAEVARLRAQYEDEHQARLYLQSLAADEIDASIALLGLLSEARFFVIDALEAHEHTDGRDLLNRIDAALNPSPSEKGAG